MGWHTGTSFVAPVTTRAEATETWVSGSAYGSKYVIETTPDGSTTRATVATFQNALITLATPVSIAGAATLQSGLDVTGLTVLRGSIAATNTFYDNTTYSTNSGSPSNVSMDGRFALHWEKASLSGDYYITLTDIQNKMIVMVYNASADTTLHITNQSDDIAIGYGSYAIIHINTSAEGGFSAAWGVAQGSIHF
jgi:hypothetical protein